MGELLNFSVYNPAILDDDDFLAGFVARSKELAALMAELHRHDANGLARHQLVIGQRGMGKTSLLRRLALGVEAEPGLASVLLPLTFREEQYNVIHLRQLWNNCLDALGDYFERKGEPLLAAEVDRDIARLPPITADKDGDAALAVIKNWGRRTGKRLLVFLDNIDFILDSLEETQSWRLRNVLQEPGGIVVVGAAAGFVEATADPGQPFYDFFHVTVLEKLGYDETAASLRAFARLRGTEGVKVLHVLDRDPARIRTLYDLTGGNPRTLAILYMLLELHIDEDVMGDLERLLDQVTVLYKARVEDLAPQARSVLDAVALNWDPVTAARAAEVTGLETTSISSQLVRLQKLGLVEKVSLSTASADGYQIGERFFNIWYLMRHGPRRQRTRLRWLTEFLRALYSPAERVSAARNYLNHRAEDHQAAAMIGFAMADAVDCPLQREALIHHATRLLEIDCQQTRQAVESIVDLGDLHASTHEMAAIERLVLECPRDWGTVKPTEFWKLLGGSASVSRKDKSRIADALAALSLIQVDGLVKIFTEEEINFSRLFGLPSAWQSFRGVIRSGLATSPDDIHGMLVAASSLGLPAILPIAARFRFDPIEWTDEEKQELGRLADSLMASPETESAAWTGNFWSGIGHIFALHLGRFEHSAQAYRKAVELDPGNGTLWDILGFVYNGPLGRYGDAEAAYRRAAELEPENALRWNDLGNLLAYRLGRYEDAEQDFRRAVKIDPKLTSAWLGLGSLLWLNLGRYEEAEQAFRRALELEPGNARAWKMLGNVLRLYLARYDEGEQAYRRAIELDPKLAAAWSGLGSVLVDHLGRPVEAAAAYRKAIELDPEEVSYPCNLAYLHLGQGAFADAEPFLHQSLEKLPPHGGALLRAFAALATDNFGDGSAALGEALGSGHAELFTSYFDDVLRVLRLAAARGYGDKLLAWLDEAGLADRYWPLRSAYEAYLHGERKLRDVNPEVGSAARRIHRWLAGACESGKPASATPPGRKRAGRSVARKGKPK